MSFEVEESKTHLHRSFDSANISSLHITNSIHKSISSVFLSGSNNNNSNNRSQLEDRDMDEGSAELRTVGGDPRKSRCSSPPLPRLALTIHCPLLPTDE